MYASQEFFQVLRVNQRRFKTENDLVPGVRNEENFARIFYQSKKRKRLSKENVHQERTKSNQGTSGKRTLQTLRLG